MVQKIFFGIAALFLFTSFLAGCSPSSNQDQPPINNAIKEIDSKVQKNIPVAEAIPYKNDPSSQYNIAMKYVEEQDFIKAFEWFNKSSNQGHSEAQHMLCAMYLEGIGIDPDYGKALDLCNKSAHQGNANAQALVGMLYYEGKAVRQDYFEAFEWFKKASEQGNSDSQLKLCAMYAEGQGVRQDHSKAFEWCKKSSEKGNIHADFNLALMYLRGQGVKQDTDIARGLFGKTCDNGIQEGCEGYKKLNQNDINLPAYLGD